MVEIPTEDLIKQTGSIFKLVVLAAKRTMELNEGYKPKIEAKDLKLSAIALQEISEGKVDFEIEE